jgi:hypothetical protein
VCRISYTCVEKRRVTYRILVGKPARKDETSF